MPIFLPQAVKKCISVLENAGYEAFCVGGAVRDLLMERGTPSDFDVTTNCLPRQVAELFPHNIPTGIKHGTVTVICDGMPIEVTTYRTEGGYTDARHPDAVNFVGSISDDLARRDFTVNAIAYNDKSGVFDPFSGLCDIKTRTLRAVGVPSERFGEDALRIMRLYRFASQLGFSVEKNTEEGAREKLHLLPKISAERIFGEFIKLLLGEHIALAAPFFLQGGLGFAGINKCDISPISLLPRDRAARFSALMLLSGSDAKAVLCNLKADNDLKGDVETVISLMKAPVPQTRAEIKAGLCRAGEENYLRYISVLEVLRPEKAKDLRNTTEDIIKKAEPYRISELCVCGDDIREKGYSGREIGEILNKLLAAVQQNPALNKRETLINLITK